MTTKRVILTYATAVVVFSLTLIGARSVWLATLHPPNPQAQIQPSSAVPVVLEPNTHTLFQQGDQGGTIVVVTKSRYVLVVTLPDIPQGATPPVPAESPKPAARR